MKKVIFLELNEFNADLLEEASQKLGLKNIQKMTSLPRTQTVTDDTYESDFLEPWVQWVSVHTGKPSSVHQIKHLGDVPHLATGQLWEKLSELGVSSGIWGAMNASRNHAKRCRFFLPDPWTASEYAYPSELNHLLMPLRYVSKNYLNRSNLKILKSIAPLLGLFISNRLGKNLIREIFPLVKNLIQFKGSHFVFISFIEYLSTLLFLRYRETFNPDLSVIFINSLAHLQHHHWTNQSNSRLKLGFCYIDRILGEIFAHLRKEDALIVANAFSQKNTNDEKPWILYRQIDQKSFLQAVGVQNFRVEPCMTHDAHIFFQNKANCERAFDLLKNAQILNQQLFIVERYVSDPTKLFYRIAFTDEVPLDTSFEIEGKNYRFFNHFKPIVRRTGKHIPQGTIYSNYEFPQTIKNHEINDTIIDLFKKEAIMTCADPSNLEAAIPESGDQKASQ